MSLENKITVSLISASILDGFVVDHPFSHYQKTSQYATFLEQVKQTPTMLLGFYEKQALAATAVLAFLKTPLLGKTGYIPTGCCVDYQDKELVERVYDALKPFALAQSLASIIVDPNVVRVSRDSSGNQIPGVNNEDLTTLLQSLDYTHRGYQVGYDDSMRNRFTLVLDCDRPYDHIVAGYAKSKVNKYKTQQALGIKTVIGDKTDSVYLAKLEAQLSKKQHFKPKPTSFFEQLFDIYQDNLTCFKTVLPINEVILVMQQELQSNKYKNDQDGKLAKERQLHQLLQFQKQGTQQLVLAIGLFIKVKNQVWDLYSYKDEATASFSGVDHMHITAIKSFVVQGVTSYDFVGFSGSVDPKDPYYGLYQYKSSFGPTFIEHIGQFEAVLQPKKHARIKQFNKVKKAIRWRLKKLVRKM